MIGADLNDYSLDQTSSCTNVEINLSNQPSGIIHSAGYFSSNQDINKQSCKWTFKLPDSYRLELM